MSKRILAGAGILALWLPLQLNAAEIVPDEGLRAEMKGQWEEAASIYRESLNSNPAQAHLWMRIADIQVRLKNLPAAKAALNEATRHAPDEAAPHVKLSQVHAVLNEPVPALAEIKRAVAIEPGNVKHLHALGTLATWNADYALAADSYERVLALVPDDAEAKLGLARAHGQLGKRDLAAQEYRAYLDTHPQDKVAMLEYIELEAERANMAAVKEYGAIYRQRFGEDLNYWLRMADIYALAGDDRASAEALQQATRMAPKDSGLYYRLSQSYPTRDDAKHARAAIEKAVELEPGNLDYLRARADLAAWAVDYEVALDSYERILKIAPDDPGAQLGIARVQSWKGNTDDALKRYKAYLEKYPQVQLVWMEYVSVATDSGNHELALELLEQYREHYGENREYLKQKARVLAHADRPTPALAIVDELLPLMRDDYDLNHTNTIALAAANRPRDALQSLDELVRLDANSTQTQDTLRYVRTPLRSNIRFSYGFQSSTDTVSSRRIGLDGEYVINPETRLFGGVDRQWINAGVGSGFEKVNGISNLGYSRLWGGVRHRVSPKVSLDAQVGRGDADGNGNSIYEVGADIQPMDELGMRVFRRQDVHAVSPLAADLGILRTANTLTFDWMPNLKYTVAGQLSLDTLSDGNERWEFGVSPRRAMLRTARTRVDLGVTARGFGYRMDPGNGYYAPRSYERYSLDMTVYRGLSFDDGIGVSMSIGPWKDANMASYRLGGDLSVEGFFGLYRDWMFNPSVSMSYYGAEGTGGFRSLGASFILVRRF